MGDEIVTIRGRDYRIETMELEYVLDGERKRFKDALVRLRSHIDSLEDTILLGDPCASLRQAVTNAAAQVANHAAAIDALDSVGKERRVEVE